MGVVKPPPKRGTLGILNTDGDDVIYYLEFQFNPTSIKRGVRSNWTLHMPPGGYRPIPMYGQHGGQTITMELFLYSREQGRGDPIRQHCMQQMAYLEMCTSPMQFADTGAVEDIGFAQFNTPPICILSFGPRLWYVLITSVDFDEEQYDLDLNPVRARASIEFVAVQAPNLNGQEIDELSKLHADAFAAENVHAGNPVHATGTSSSLEEP